jgi:hypothetical protein
MILVRVTLCGPSPSILNPGIRIVNDDRTRILTRKSRVKIEIKGVGSGDVSDGEGGGVVCVCQVFDLEDGGVRPYARRWLNVTCRVVDVGCAVVDC